MRIIFALLLCLLAAPAHADNYDVLFGKSMWLNTSRPVTAEDAKGRAVLLDFWTYGCINCMQVIPEIKALEKEFGDKLLVIGVHSAKFVGERDSDRIQAAAKRFGITHPVINDSEFTVWKAMGVKAWPTLLLLGPDGTEVGRYAGEGNREAIAAEIKKLSLGEVKAAGLEMKQEEVSHVFAFPSRVKLAKNTRWEKESGAGFAKRQPWEKMLIVASTGNNTIVGWRLDGHGVRMIGPDYKVRKDDEGYTKFSFNHPRGFAETDEGIYIADTDNHLLRFKAFNGGGVKTVAGTGERGLYPQVKDHNALDIPLASPWDVALMADGKTLVIAMAGLHQLWTYDIEKKTVSTLAGTGAEGIKDGPANEATLAQPSGLAIDGDTIYFVDAESSSLRMLKDGQIKTLIGTGLFDYGLVDGKYPKAMLQHPQGLSVYKGKIYIADTYNNAIRVYDIATATLSTVKQNNPMPAGVKIDGATLAQLTKNIPEPTDVLVTDDAVYITGSDLQMLSTWNLKDGELTRVWPAIGVIH